MEASRSARDLDADDEDMESFLKTIKLHDRFVDDYYNEDEDIFSDEELNADLSGRPKGQCSKRENDHHHPVLSSEAKAEALSMLDTVRSSYRKSGRSTFNLLNLKSDESGLGDRDDPLLAESFCCRPPFGDPLSEDDILSSALNLLDDEQCKKFREAGLFDGFVVKGDISADAEKRLEDSGTNFTDRGLDLTPTMQQSTPEKPSHNPWNVLTSIPKSEDVKEIDVLPLTRPEISESVLQNTEPTKEQSISKKKIIKCFGNDNDISVNDHSRVSGDSLSVSAFKSSSQGPKKKTRGKKGKINPEPSTDANAAKSKISPTKKTVLASDSPLEKFDLSSEEKGDDVETIDGIRHSTDGGNSASSSTGLVPEVLPSDFGFAEDEGIGEEFTIVFNKKKSRMQKDAHCPVDLDGGSPKDKRGMHSRFSSPAAALNVAFRPTPRSFGSNDGVLSKRSSCTSINEPSVVVSNTSARNECHESSGLSDRLSGPGPSYSSPNKTPAPNSYASALSQNLPRLSVSEEIDELPVKEDFDAHNPELETAGLLSPPQSEADTGFSSASSLGPDETNANSLTHDRTTEVNLAALSSLSFSSEKEKADIYQDQSSTSRETVVEESVASDDLKRIPLPSMTPRGASIERCNLEIASYGKSFACSSQLQLAQQHRGEIFFDTRKPRVPDRAAPSDIVFGFDSGDECGDVGTDSGAAGDILHPHVNFVDLKDVTFFAGSSRGTDSADGLSSSLDILSPKTSDSFARDGTSEGGDDENPRPSAEMSLKDASFHIASSKPENVEKSVDHHSDMSNARDYQREHLEEVRVSERNNRRKDLCIKNSSLHSGDDDTKTRNNFSSYSKFDLRAAQKFLSRAFESILGQESESTDKLLRF